MAHSGGGSDCCSMLLSVLILLGSGASSKSGESERDVSLSATTRSKCFFFVAVPRRSLVCGLMDSQQGKPGTFHKSILP